MEPSERVPGAFVIAVGSVALCGVVMSSHCVQKAFKMVHVGLIHALPSWPAHPKNAHGHASAKSIRRPSVASPLQISYSDSR